MFRILACFAAATLFVGCAAPPDLKQPAGNDPANPQALESPVVSLPQPLALQPPPDESATATQPATTQALYTCEMHPQVVSDHPGKCPICGMKLVPKAGGK